MIEGLLLGAQAAGMIVDYMSTRGQQKMIGQARRVENAAFEANLEALRVQSAEESLAEMKQLRQNLGTQMVINAARGTASGMGTAASLARESVGAFQTDERRRRMNLLASEAQLRGANVLSGLHTLKSETALGRQLAMRTLDTVSLSNLFQTAQRTDIGKAAKGFFEELF